MENHLHFIASAPDLSAQVGDFKSFTARKIIDLLKTRGEASILGQLRSNRREDWDNREYQLWEDGSHPKQISNDPMMLQKLEYMHNNPVRRGYVDDPVHWRYSSARNYFGLPGLIPVTTSW